MSVRGKFWWRIKKLQNFPEARLASAACSHAEFGCDCSLENDYIKGRVRVEIVGVGGMNRPSVEGVTGNFPLHSGDPRDFFSLFPNREP